MRSELKYLVPKEALPRLRALLMPFMRLDRHGVGFENRGYTVRSIYLDTATLRYFQEKEAGLKVRRKLRIRGYNDWRPGDWVFLEIKRKVEDKVHKNRAPVLFKDLTQLFATGDVASTIIRHPHYPEALADAHRFCFHLYRYNLRPTHLTVYEREAFLGRFDSSLRITFDRNLRGGYYPALADLYSESGLRHVYPGFFIMEVKYNTRFPVWIRPMLAEYALRNRSLSKYCMCAELFDHHLDRKTAVLAQAPRIAYPAVSHPILPALNRL